MGDDIFQPSSQLPKFRATSIKNTTFVDQSIASKLTSLGAADFSTRVSISGSAQGSLAFSFNAEEYVPPKQQQNFGVTTPINQKLGRLSDLDLRFERSPVPKLERRLTPKSPL